MSTESRTERDGDNDEKVDPGKVCRDYVNNICNRGSRCKFYHPPSDKPKEEYNFCIDFQNQGCKRASCRFVHADAEDVALYRRSGDITLSLAHAIARATRADTINGIPICKEFQTGQCERNLRCRYWHIAMHNSEPVGVARSDMYDHLPRLPMPAGHYPPTKRRHMIPPQMYGDYEGGRPPKRGAFIPPPMMAGMSSHRVADLERRNAELSTEVEALKRELSREKERYEDLMALFRQSNTVAAAAAAVSWTPAGSANGRMPDVSPKYSYDSKYSW